jgi:hypothetical protein
MMLVNRVSRFDVAAQAVAAGAKVNPKVATIAHEKRTHFMHLARKEKEYAYEHGQGRFISRMKEDKAKNLFKIVQIHMRRQFSNRFHK